MEISYKGRIYNFDRPDGLSNKSFYDRSWFIVRMEPKNQQDFERVERDADIFLNRVFNGCGYSKDLDEIVNKRMMSDNYFSTFLK